MKHLGLCAAAALLLAGCIGAREVELTRHYTLDTVIAVEEFEKMPMTLGVRQFASTKPVALPMAYRKEGLRIDFHRMDLWDEHPEDALTRTVTDALVETQRFADVGDASDLARPDLLLTGEVRLFHLNLQPDNPTAELEVRLELREARDQGLVWAETVRTSTPTEDTSPEAFAASMSEAVSAAASHAANAMAAAVDDYEPMQGL